MQKTPWKLNGCRCLLLLIVWLSLPFHDIVSDVFYYRLFLVQVYHMASLRLRDLCLRLDIDNDLLQKVRKIQTHVGLYGCVHIFIRFIPFLLIRFISFYLHYIHSNLTHCNLTINVTILRSMLIIFLLLSFFSITFEPGRDELFSSVGRSLNLKRWGWASMWQFCW